MHFFGTFCLVYELFMLNIEKQVYLTKNGLKRLFAEMSDLKAIRMQKVLEPESEEDVSFIDVRLQEIDEAVKTHALITAPAKDKKDVVAIGATVLLNVAGKEKKFTIVGSVEADPTIGFISNESPLGRALLERKIGDSFSLKNNPKAVYEIKNISYELFKTREG